MPFFAVNAGHVELVDGVIGIGFGDGFKQSGGFLGTLFGGADLAHVGNGGVPLHGREPLISEGQFPLQTGIAGRVLRHPVEVLRCTVQQEFARGGCSGHVLQRIVDVEDERIGKLAHVVEALLRSFALPARDAGLALGGRDARDQREHHQGGSGYTCTVTGDELSGGIAPRASGRGDGQSVEVAVDVFGELLHRSVAAFGLLAQGHEQNAVEVARQTLAEARGRWLALAQDGMCARVPASRLASGSRRATSPRCWAAADRCR